MKKIKFNKTSSLLFLIETFYYILCPFSNKKFPKAKEFLTLKLKKSFL